MDERWIAILMLVFFCFDFWRALDRSEFFGRPWPGISRDDGVAFWCFQAFRAVAILFIIGMLLQLDI